jgi:hypothetical protein
MDYLVMEIGHTLEIRAFFAEGDPCSGILKTRFIKKKPLKLISGAFGFIGTQVFPCRRKVLPE